MDWHNITLHKYLKMKEVFSEKEIDEVDKGIELVSILYDCDGKQLLISDFNKKLQDVNKLLLKKVPKEKVKANYGEYQLVVEPTLITTSQFIDIQTFQKNDDILGMLSCVLIPKEHIYNDGYSIDDLREYLLQMPITEALGILGFFMNVCYSYEIHSVKSLLKTVSDNSKKKLLKKQLNELQKKISDYCLSY